jgi:HK97 family phage major capsid protein
MITISNLTTKKADLISKAESALRTGGANSAEYRSLLAQVDEVTQHISDLAYIERNLPSGAVAAPVTAPSITVTPESPEKRKHKINQAAKRFFKEGAQGLSIEERALLTTSDATGGALISQAFDTVFTEAAKYFGPIWNLVNRKDATNSEPTKYVVSDDTARTFSLLTEGSGSSSAVKQTPTLFSDITDTDTLVSSVVFSIQELNDAFDLETFLTRNAGVAVSRAWEYAITLGLDNGTNTALPNSPAGGLLAGVTPAVTQAAGTLAAGPTTAQLQALAGSVDRAYYQTGSFMASPSVETFLRSQVTTIGSPLYPVDSEGYLVIAGKRLWPNAAMAAAGTASKPLVLFGNIAKNYNVLNAGGLKIKVIGSEEGDPALASLTRSMIMYTRIGASVGLSTAVKSLVSAAS